MNVAAGSGVGPDDAGGAGERGDVLIGNHQDAVPVMDNVPQAGGQRVHRQGAGADAKQRLEPGHKDGVLIGEGGGHGEHAKGDTPETEPQSAGQLDRVRPGQQSRGSIFGKRFQLHRCLHQPLLLSES